MKLVIINGLDSQPEEFGFYQWEGEVWATLSDNSFPALLLGKHRNSTEKFKADGKENPVGGNGDLPKTVLVHENSNVTDALRPHPANQLTDIYSDSASWIPINPRCYVTEEGGRRKATEERASGDRATFPMSRSRPGASVWLLSNCTRAAEEAGTEPELPTWRVPRTVRCLLGRSVGTEEALEPCFSNLPACETFLEHLLKCGFLSLFSRYLEFPEKSLKVCILNGGLESGKVGKQL